MKQQKRKQICYQQVQLHHCNLKTTQLRASVNLFKPQTDIKLSPSPSLPLCTFVAQGDLYLCCLNSLCQNILNRSGADSYQTADAFVQIQDKKLQNLLCQTWTFIVLRKRTSCTLSRKISSGGPYRLQVGLITWKR